MVLAYILIATGCLALLFIAVLLAQHRDAATHRKELERAIAQFDRLKHLDENPMSYDGKSAKIVLERVDFGQRLSLRGPRNQLILHRIFRNEFGEYFVFISGERPFVEHLTPERAMNALRANPKAFEREFSQAAPTEI